MNKVSSILSRKGKSIVSIPSTTAVIDALKLMSEKNIGSVVVMDGEKYAGIITERDYSRKIVLKGKSSTDTKVAEIMTTDLPTVKPDDSIEHCRELMGDKNVRYLPVFDKEMLVGIISMSDVVKETILLQKETISHLESYIHSNI
ncbi:MAG: CBS domain-containing protein [Proteobacteria bacterium]|nr:CBS domain-containing protein [Pseudomonadota bacterium]MBS1920502.1 CBS domain-containing protein [Bacteroidota bacterium]MBS1931099.1 CBS domain-containing protein [Bacteroidota bacterium]